MRNSPEGSHTTPIGTDWVSDKILGKVKWYYYQYFRVVLILHETEKLAWFWNYPLLHYVTWSPKFESLSVTDGREAEGEISKRKGLKQTFVVGQWVGRGLTIKYTQKQQKGKWSFFVRKRSGIPKSLTITLGLKKEQRASGVLFLFGK